MSVAAREHHLLTAAYRAGSLTAEIYVALILDAISTGQRHPLPPAAALRYAPESGWPV
jgi:hypothetical protein